MKKKIIITFMACLMLGLTFNTFGSAWVNNLTITGVYLKLDNNPALNSVWIYVGNDVYKYTYGTDQITQNAKAILAMALSAKSSGATVNIYDEGNKDFKNLIVN